MSTNTQVKKNTNTVVKTIVMNGLLIALTFVATAFINIKLPINANGGLVHLGNVPLFIAAIIYGRKSGAIAGAFGMAFFDLVSGWTAWAPFTFVIVGAMGYVVGLICQNKEKYFALWYVIAMVAALALKIGGYYVAEGFIYGNWIAPVNSIPGNIVQVGTAAIATFPLVITLRKILLKKEA